MAGEDWEQHPGLSKLWYRFLTARGPLWSECKQPSCCLVQGSGRAHISGTRCEVWQFSISALQANLCWGKFICSVWFCPQCLSKVAASFPASREVPLRARVFQLQALGKFEPSPSKSWDSFNTYEVVFVDCCPFCLLPDLWVMFSSVFLPREAAQCSYTKYCKNVFNIHATIWFLGEIPNIVSIAIKALHLATLEAS